MRALTGSHTPSVRRARKPFLPAIAVGAVLAAAAGAGSFGHGPDFSLTGGTTSTAPTPPDLFVGYSPLVSQGTTPGADTVQSFDTAGLASLGSAQVGAQPIAEADSPDGGTVYSLNANSDNITAVDTLTSPPEVSGTYSLPSGFSPTAFAVTPNGSDAYVVGVPNVSNSENPSVWEISLASGSAGTLARTIQLPASSSPAGIAVTPNGAEALITDFSGGGVIPVNLSNGKVGTEIGVGLSPGSGSGPLGIQVTPNGSDAFVANSEDGSVSEINLSTNHVTSVPLETSYLPQQLAVSPDGSTVWVTEDNGTAAANAGFLVPVAVSDLTVGSPVSVGDDPNGVAISPDGSTVYVADETDSAGGVGSDEGSITVVPTSSSGSVQTLDTDIDPSVVLVTPDEAPFASFTSAAGPAGGYTTFDASASYSLTSGGLTYSWNFGDGSTTPPTTDPVTKHVYLLPGTYTVTLSVTDASGTSTQVIYNGQYVLNNGGPSAGDTRSVTVPGATANRPPIAYVTNSQSNSVTPILADPLQSSAPNDAGPPIPVGTHPDAIAITPNGKTAYAVNFGSDNVTPIDTASDTAAPSGSWIAVGSEPNGIAISPDGSTAYVTNSGDGTVSKIALSTGQVVATIKVGGSPSGIAITPDGSTAYVTDNGAGYDDVIPITLATDAVGSSISDIGSLTDPLAIAITPNGDTAFVVDRGSNVVAGAAVAIDLTGTLPSAGTRIATGDDPDGIAISPAGDYAYVTNGADGTVTQIAISGHATNTLSAGNDPAGIAVTPSGDAAYVADAVPGGSGGTVPGSVAQISVPAAAASPNPISVGTAPDAIAITPDEAPVAVLRVTPAAATQPSSFDASQSTFPSSPAASYTWAFGDGTSPQITTTPTTTHVYATGGNYNASVTITDADGTSTTQSFTGQTVSLNGGPGAMATAVVHVPFAVPVVTGVSPSSGDAGSATSIIVSGSNFFGVTAVNVGSATVTSFTVNAAGTQISNVLAPPAAAGSVDVTVTNPAGTSAITPADVFTYLPTTTPPPDSPAVTALSSDSGPEAGGTGVTITGTNLTGATAVDFGSVAATTFTVNSTGTQITVVSPPATTPGTVDVTVTTPIGTSPVTTADVFTYLAPPSAPTTPTITGLSPDDGPTSGLTTVVVSGTNLTGVTAVYFGSDPAESYSSTSSTSLTAVSPAVPSAGTVDVTVVTLNGTSAVVPADAYTYESGTSSAGPVVTGVSPGVGPLAGGTTVVITGSNFTGIPPSGVDFGTSSAQFSVNSAGTQITASSPASAVPQTVDIVVTNPLGASTITPADTFTYEPNANFAPTVTTVTPQSGPQAGGTAVVLTGTNFAGATKVWFGSTAVTDFTLPGSGNEIDVTAPASTSPETVSVEVTNPYGTSSPTTADAYTYLPPSPSTTGPQVTAIDPVSGPVSGGTGVEITGTGFTGATAVDFGSTAASSYTVNSAGTEIVSVAPAAAAPGSVDVTVTAGGQTSPVVAADAYTYLSSGSGGGGGPPPPPPTPTVTGLAPASGPTIGGTVVTITGTNLTGVTVVDIGAAAGTDVVVASSGTSLTVKTPATPYAGPVEVTVTTHGGTSATNGSTVYTYIAPISRYHALAPYRLLDTRRAGSGGPLGAGSTRTITVAGVDGVPAGATAAEVNLTATDTTASTYLTAFPTSDPMPTVSSLVAAKGQTVAHLVEVPLGAGGAISVYNHAGSSHVVVDLQGYYTAATSGGAGRYHSVTPKQVFTTDSKAGGGPIKSRQSREVKLTGLGGVPKSGVQAVAFDLTATDTTGSSYAEVYPAGVARPLASNLNWQKGGTATNLVIAKLGSKGSVEVFNHSATTQLAITVVGYVTSGSSGPGDLGTPTVATQAWSSGASPIGSGKVRSLHLAGVAGVPSGATGVVLDVTTSSNTAASWLSVYAAGATRPATGQLAWAKGAMASNLVVVPLGPGGVVDLYNHLGDTSVIVTLEGYFTS